MSYQEFCRIIYTEFTPDHSWYKFYQTRDWYDMPANIRENDWIYDNPDAIQRARYRQKPGRFLIYPKDIEFMYDCTQGAARSLIDAIRESQDLSVSVPITYYDLQEYTGLDMQTIHDFIMES